MTIFIICGLLLINCVRLAPPACLHDPAYVSIPLAIEAMLVACAVARWRTHSHRPSKLWYSQTKLWSGVVNTLSNFDSDQVASDSKMRPVLIKSARSNSYVILGGYLLT